VFNLGKFKPVERIETPDFILQKLTPADVERDFATFMSNKDAIKLQRGGVWPDGTETLEDDKIDLSWHQREFELGTSFAYQVVSTDELEMIGCVYFYPPDHPNNGASQYEPEGIDASVSIWTTEKHFRLGVYDQLYLFTQQWLKQWPYSNPHITNLQKPGVAKSTSKL